MAAHSNILAWRIPWTEAPGSLTFHRVIELDTTEGLSTTHILTRWNVGVDSAQSLSCVRLFVTPQIAAHQAPPSLGFSRQEHWSGLPCPPPGNLPNPGIEPVSLMSPGLAGKVFTTSTT